MSNNTKWTELRKTASDKDIIVAMEGKYPDLYKDLMAREWIVPVPSMMFKIAEMKQPETSGTASESVVESVTDMDGLGEFENINPDFSFEMNITEDGNSNILPQFRSEYSLAYCYLKHSDLPRWR